MKATIFAGVIACLCLLSCSSKNKLLMREELISYINNKNNGLVQQQDINGIQVKVFYQPSSLMVQQELRADTQRSRSFIHSLEKKYNDNYYFMLQFSKNGKEIIRQLGSFERYSDMVQVFAFKMNQFVNITTPQKDTVGLTDYLFEQTYGMGSGNSILLSFNKEKLKDKKEIEINVSECGLGTGNLKFRFDKNDLDKTPALDYTRTLL